MKRKIVTAVIAFILCAAVVPTAGIYSVMAENEDTLQVEDGADYAALSGVWKNEDAQADETLTLSADGLFVYHTGEGDDVQGYLEYVDEYNDGNGRYDMYNRMGMWLEDFLDVFDTLHLPVGPYEMWILHPELFPRGMEEIKGFSTEKKRRTLADYYLHQAAPLEIEQEYYILFGDHGSNSCGIRQELLANLQTPLRDRKRIVNQIIDNYYEARAIGHLTDPEGQQPVMPILEACYDASARSVKANENRYSIGSIEDYLDDAEKPAEE